MQTAEAYLEATAHMDNDHHRGGADNPDRVSQGVQDLVPSVLSKCMVARVGHTKVAVSHKQIGNCHTKLQPTKQLVRKHPLAEGERSHRAEGACILAWVKALQVTLQMDMTRQTWVHHRMQPQTCFTSVCYPLTWQWQMDRNLFKGRTSAGGMGVQQFVTKLTIMGAQVGFGLVAVGREGMVA